MANVSNRYTGFSIKAKPFFEIFSHTRVRARVVVESESFFLYLFLFLLVLFFFFFLSFFVHCTLHCTCIAFALHLHCTCIAFALHLHCTCIRAAIASLNTVNSSEDYWLCR